MSTITFDLLPAATEEILDRLDAIEKLLMKKHPDPKKKDGYITRKDVCKLLHITLVTVHAWMKNGKLKPYHVGGRTLFLESEVLAAVKPVNYDLNKKAR